MNESRRSFLRKGSQIAATAGVLGVTGAMTSRAAESKAAPMVAACGLACNVCPLMKAGKCKGCGAANAVPAEMVTKKNCPVLNCASMKKIAYCGTDCKMFTECGKLIGRPYDKAFMGKIKSRLG